MGTAKAPDAFMVCPRTDDLNRVRRQHRPTGPSGRTRREEGETSTNFHDFRMHTETRHRGTPFTEPHTKAREFKVIEDLWRFNRLPLAEVLKNTGRQFRVMSRTV